MLGSAALHKSLISCEDASIVCRPCCSSDGGSWTMLLRDVLTVEPQFCSLPPCDLSKASRQEIRQYFLNSYGLNETLFVSLKDESVFYKCPDRLRLPLIFYYGHTAAVYVNKLILAGLLKKRINIHYESLFETGVDEMSWDDLENYRMGGSYTWPTLKEVRDYRREVKEAILQIIDTTELVLPVAFDSPLWSLFMGMEHERIHFETSSVLIRQLPISMVCRPQGWRYGPIGSGSNDMVQNELVAVPEEEVTVGKPYSFPSYGWDNEYGSWKVKVPAFEASKYKITNGEFLQFVRDGGYDRRELWTTEGWKWRTFRQSRHPVFWVCSQGCKSGCGADLASYSHCSDGQSRSLNGTSASECENGHHDGPDTSEVGMNGHGNQATSDEYRLRLMFDLVDLPRKWPVEVNYHEAKAYCNWMGSQYRLPAEAEHHAMRGNSPSTDEGADADFIYWPQIPYNTNFLYGSSTPVDMFPPTSAGFYDVFGNVWEWSEDQFNGLPDGRTSYLYDDFSSPCYDGQHNMILGGSWVSTGDEASRFARYAFRRHFIQHCGFRIVRSLAAVADGSKEYTVPARLVSTEVFTRGFGLIENPITLPPGALPLWVKSTNVQFDLDTEAALKTFIGQEYGTDEPVNLAVQVARLTADVVTAQAGHRSPSSRSPLGDRSLLHIGVSVGRTETELVELGFLKIIGIETSGRLIDEAMRRFEMRKDAENVIFKQFTWIPNEVGHFDVVLFTAVDRVSNVKAWTKRLNEVITARGIAILVSVNNRYSTESLQSLMPPRFQLLDERNLVWSTGLGNALQQATATVWGSAVH